MAVVAIVAADTARKAPQTARKLLRDAHSVFGNVILKPLIAALFLLYSSIPPSDPDIENALHSGAQAATEIFRRNPSRWYSFPGEDAHRRKSGRIVRDTCRNIF